MNDVAVKKLASSGITPEEATKLGMFYVADASTIYSDFRPLPALCIPYFDVRGAPVTFSRDGELRPFVRVRYLVQPNERHGFVKQRFPKYMQPAASGTRAYFPRVEDPDWSWEAAATNTGAGVIITEGELKAAKASLCGYPAIGLGGVFNFLAGGELLPELASWNWGGRDTYICFDSDALSNPNIQAAEGKLVTELGRRGATVHIVRLKPRGDGEKQGLDDLLTAYGCEALDREIAAAERSGVLDTAIIGLNQHVAIIESEGCVYDVEARQRYSVGFFTRGSRFSSLHVASARRAPGQRGAGETRQINVANIWITHPHARRYQQILFRPGVDELSVPAENGQGEALNIWRGWDAGDGDVAPFLELNQFLMSNLDPEHRMLALDLVTYKAQNPAEKVKIAPVIVGQQGSGKTLWAECVREAFSPYGIELASSELGANFQPWLESSLIAVINEAESDHLAYNKDVLKRLITEERVQMNDKYRPKREISSYTMYILTSNTPSVGAFSHDDRRMFVIRSPEKRNAEFYDRVGAWRKAGGPRALLGWMLRRDLKGWKPPPSAPLTAEKVMAYQESLSPAHKLGEDMRTADYNVVRMWLDQAATWARGAELTAGREASLAREVLTLISTIQIRPWYSSEEIAMLFPAVVSQLHGNRRMRRTAAGEISNELREVGVPYLRNRDDPRGFRFRGALRQFLVVCDWDDWRDPITQADFDRLMATFPKYGDIANKVRSIKT